VRPDLGEGWWQEAGRRFDVALDEAGGEGALKVAQSNKRMHATADTTAVKYNQRCMAARDARR
jgi:hypothetical protein